LWLGKQHANLSFVGELYLVVRGCEENIKTFWCYFLATKAQTFFL